ncbi:hypothetical protein AGMMS49992_25600 [Clostridia bacterium]|nr:hypothetical protein AGMMS49992_25600 [Clostridia bacterium]
MVENHPYQYEYYNTLAGNNIADRFDFDMSDVPQPNLIKKVVQAESEGQLYFVSYGPLSLGAMYYDFLLTDQEYSRTTLLSLSDDPLINGRLIATLPSKTNLPDDKFYLLYNATRGIRFRYYNSALYVDTSGTQWYELPIAYDITVDGSLVQCAYEMTREQVEYIFSTRADTVDGTNVTLRQ